MQVFLGIISVAFLGGIIYFLISPKSSRLLRMSAIIALALIGLAVGVCGVFLIRGPGEVDTMIPLPFLTDAEPKPKAKTNIGVILGYFVAFAIIFGFVAYSSKKEKGRKYEPVKKTVKKEVFQSTDENKLDLGQAPGDDESFDIGGLD
jgi:drug/metabolite transporter (DMT)-like permease